MPYDRDFLTAQFKFPKPGEPLWEFYLASDNGKLDDAKAMLLKDPSLRTRENYSIFLVNSVEHARRDMIEFALHHKADVNFVNRAGLSPLRMALRQGEPEIFLLLLQAGANPLEKDSNGKSLKQLASWSDLAGAVEILALLNDKKRMADLGFATARKKQKPPANQS